ncbi:unnamed protein product [Zymoseptoria tritici ST99CH_3D7]|uniref:3-hydroxyacyl-CoA dehydrogenase n=1 Tax=Zymoseptoria tritici (strain ST99CH_3D7) TaxID=1276538 RepID=A0A1X7RR22_ZYMT9|nr:unnamed protein product [Zymoseptoria tritici ST99CH_3D7]
MSTNNQSSWQAPKNWESRPVCVLGGGVLGRRIGACFVAAGHTVRIRDPSQKARDDAAEYIKTNISAFTALSQREKGSVEAVEDFAAAVKDCWMVIEAVPEVLKIKEETFADLEEHAPADCLLATNSSSYKSGEMVGQIKDETKKRVFNAHFMMPPEAVIVELMTSGYTDQGSFPFLEERFKEAGLHPIVALKESTGFIFNRIWAAIKREVLSVLAEGVATPETIDSMWREQYGSPVGPCTMMDSVGLDTVEHIEQHYIDDRKLPTYHLDWLKDNYISAGKLGNKSDKGGLYKPKASGEGTKLLLLNVGLGEPLRGKSQKDIMNAGQVLSFNVDDRNARPIELVGKLALPDGIYVSKKTNRIYWTNMGTVKGNGGSIQSSKMDGSDVQYVLKPGEIHTPKQMVIDQETDQIYVCDREGLRVMRCNLDGSNLETLYRTGDWETEQEKVDDGTYWPVGISISKKLGKFFWTQKGHAKADEGRIFSANLKMPENETPDNRSDVEVVMKGLPECIDLEMDDESGVLYWTDRGEIPFGNTLNKKQMIGQSPEAEGQLGRQIIAQGLGEGIGLCLHKERKCLYVTDMGGHLWKCSVDGGPKEKLYEGATHAYTGVTFYQY